MNTQLIPLSKIAAILIPSFILIGCGGSSSGSSNGGTPAPTTACSIFGGTFSEGAETYQAIILGDPDIIVAMTDEISADQGTDVGDLCQEMSLSKSDVLYVENGYYGRYRGHYSMSENAYRMIWQGANEYTPSQDYGAFFEQEDANKRGPLWVSQEWESVENSYSNYMWLLTQGQLGQGETNSYHSTQQEALSASNIDETKLLTTDEMVEEWDHLYSYWLTHSLSSLESNTTLKSGRNWLNVE